MDRAVLQGSASKQAYPIKKLVINIFCEVCRIKVTKIQLNTSSYILLPNGLGNQVINPSVINSLHRFLTPEDMDGVPVQGFPPLLGRYPGRRSRKCASRPSRRHFLECYAYAVYPQLSGWWLTVKVGIK